MSCLHLTAFSAKVQYHGCQTVLSVAFLWVQLKKLEKFLCLCDRLLVKVTEEMWFSVMSGHKVILSYELGLYT